MSKYAAEMEFRSKSKFLNKNLKLINVQHPIYHIWLYKFSLKELFKDLFIISTKLVIFSLKILKKKKKNFLTLWKDKKKTKKRIKYYYHLSCHHLTQLRMKKVELSWVDCRQMDCGEHHSLSCLHIRLGGRKTVQTKQNKKNVYHMNHDRIFLKQNYNNQ